MRNNAVRSIVLVVSLVVFASLTFAQKVRSLPTGVARQKGLSPRSCPRSTPTRSSIRMISPASGDRRETE